MFMFTIKNSYQRSIQRTQYFLVVDDMCLGASRGKLSISFPNWYRTFGEEKRGAR